MSATPAKPDYEGVHQHDERPAPPPDRVIVYALLVLGLSKCSRRPPRRRPRSARARLGIRVSSAEGGHLTLLAASIRTWPIYLPTLAALLGIGASWLVSLFALIACVAVALSVRKQGLHDKMAGAVIPATRSLGRAGRPKPGR